MDRKEPTAQTAHVDTFCRDSLPPPELMPDLRFDALPELAYPPRLNCSVELLDRIVEQGGGERTVFHFPGGRWTYRQLLETANRIAHVLVEDLGVVPGHRVLLRAPNNPMLAACWFAVLKAGGVVVCTMPLLRVRELTYIVEKAKIRLALSDARVAGDCEAAMPNVVHFQGDHPDSLATRMEGKPVTFERWKEATGLSIIDGIGSTEMLHIFISSSGDDIRPGSTGKVVPGYAARVVDGEGNEVPPGTLGHLAVRGPTGCRYLDNLERQRGYVKNGWNHPGDSYIMDADGYFWYQARTDDMIISAGHNISGPEVEAVLLDHPAVAECGVVGAPDEIRGRIVKAYVVLRPGVTAGPERVKELQDFVKAEIAPYKYPRAIEFVDSLPRTETGKLQRFRLRERDR